MNVRNVFACLVHESPDCVIDLVRNLHYLDPGSSIVLYNGSTDPDLIDRRFPFERYGATIYPGLRQVTWGRLHDPVEPMQVELRAAIVDRAKDQAQAVR